MSIITLTTDFGLKDHYVSSVKGAILNQLPDTTIVDISHFIEKFNIQEAAFILKNAYANFPKGSVHIIGVKTEQGTDSSHLVVFSDEHYFICADNGIFSLLFDNPIEKIIALPDNNSTFPTYDIFVKAACEIVKGKPIEELGTIRKNVYERIPFRAASIGDMIKGTVVYIDSYGNVITNINLSFFNQIAKGRNFVLEFARYEINNLSVTYNDVPEGEILALFNASNQLEIAMNNDKANSMLNLKLNDSITIRF